MSNKKSRRAARTFNLYNNELIADGLDKWRLSDLYFHCMTMRWPTFFGLLGVFFLGLNTFFAALYYGAADSVANLNPDGFLGYFFFSVETLATVGYGDMHPNTLWGHGVATFEIFVGMMGMALITGMVFARFSRPRPRIVFSKHPIIRKMNGVDTLMLRTANARLNAILEASAKLRLLREEITPEGVKMRRIHDLDLVREQTPMFMLSWTLMHVINEQSPLFQMSPHDLASPKTLLVLSLSGTDETTNHTLQTRQIYPTSLIRHNHAYRDLVHTDAEGQDHVDYQRIDDTYALDNGDVGPAS
jgi:inward rectifier potassium channel